MKKFAYEIIIETDNGIQDDVNTLGSKVCNIIANSLHCCNNVTLSNEKMIGPPWGDAPVENTKASEPNYVQQMSQPDVTREQTIIGLADKKKRLLIEIEVNLHNTSVARSTVAHFANTQKHLEAQLHDLDIQIEKAIKS